MSEGRPNTLLILLFLIWEGILVLGESIYKSLVSLLFGKIIPLRTSRLLQLWHWFIAKGPKRFWQFPRAIQIGRLLSTTIQAIFYQQKNGQK